MPPRRGVMEIFVLWVERLAGVFLFLVALTTVVTVVSRKGFDVSPPDSFDVARLLLGIAICWGIASSCYRNGHIMVDVVWELAGPRWKRVIDITATSIVLAFMAAFAWMLGDAVAGTYAANIGTVEMKMPVWPFHAIAELGIVSATI
jgi:TRAP-type C4-dicarboxylate transport system permease small subunit